MVENVIVGNHFLLHRIQGLAVRIETSPSWEEIVHTGEGRQSVSFDGCLAAVADPASAQLLE